MTSSTYFSSPPRDVPLTVKVRVLFGEAISYFGWFFLGFGSVFMWGFATNADVSSLYLFRGNLDQARGTVVTSQQTHLSEGSSHHRVPIYQHRYSFAVNGTTYAGVSYSLGGGLSTGAAVTVEYPHGDPAHSRIQGMRRAPFGPSVLFVLIFPMVGLIIVIRCVRQGCRANRLLAQGKVAMGSLVLKEPTKTSVNGRLMYKMTFEFQADDGQKYSTVAQSNRPELLENDPQKQLVYDPQSPTKAVVIDSLPGSPRIDERGLIQPGGFWLAIRSMLIPFAVIVGNATWLCIKLFR